MTRTHHTFTIEPTGHARAGFGLRMTNWVLKADENIPVLAASGAG